MKFLVKYKETLGVRTIVQVETLLKEDVTPGADEIVCELNDDAKINKLLNDFSHVRVDKSGSTWVLDTSSASEDTHVRKATSWRPLTRLALMRAATTTHLFNA